MLELELIEYSKNATTTEEALRSMSMLRKLRKEKADLERKLEKASKWEAFFEKAKPHEEKMFNDMGFFMGVVLVISQIFRFYNGLPTTLEGSVLALVVAFITGRLFARIFGVLLGKEIAEDIVDSFRDRGEELWEKIEEVDWKIRHCTHYSD